MRPCRGYCMVNVPRSFNKPTCRSSKSLETLKANLIACLAPWKPCYCMRAGGSAFFIIQCHFLLISYSILNLFAKVSTLTTDQARIASYYRNEYKSHIALQITARRANFAQLAPTDLRVAKNRAVYNRWTGLLDWTTGLDYWTTGLTQNSMKRPFQ